MKDFADLSPGLGLDRLAPRAGVGARSARLVASWDDLLATSRQTLAGHGDLPRLLEAVSALEVTSPRELALMTPVVASRATPPLGEHERWELERSLRALGPWKKGPFDLDGVRIDAEWRSDLKWQRVEGLPLDWSGAQVLDVGTGNGYFLLRALGAGARSVLGVEPGVTSIAQFLAVRRFFSEAPLALLPLPAESFVSDCQAFDIVMSMGVLYHRRSPFDHLHQLRGFAKSGGRLVLETLVVDGPEGHCLVPEGRYAQMRNVWFLPSRLTLESWLRKMKLRIVACPEAVRTTSEEQRATDWTGQPSLADFLDPADPSRTIEGHPAPQRLLLLCEVP